MSIGIRQRGWVATGVTLEIAAVGLLVVAVTVGQVPQ